MADTHKGFKFKLITIIASIIILLGVLVVAIWGFGSITKFILIMVQGILFLSVIFGLAYLFWYLFLKKHRFDVNYVNKQKLVEAFTKIKRPELKDLYLSGDKAHSRVQVGTITGYGRIQVLTRNYVYEDGTDKHGNPSKQLKLIEDHKGDLVPQYTLGKQEQDVFIVKTKGVGGVFGDSMVIRVSPEDHDELIGDVTLYGFSLIPIGEYWFLNSDHLDIRKIDYAILKEAERTISFETMRDMKELIDSATGIDAKHIKKIEEKSLIEIPETSGQIGGR